MMTKLPVIAIDGYSSTGKSSISKEIAKRLGIIHLDTGALYRAITYFALQNCPSTDGFNTVALVEQLPNIHLEFKEEQHQLSLFLNGENVAEKIRSMEVNQKVSDVAKMPEVRNFLLQTQRDIAANGGVVMDGRDIGSVVLPNADYKFFLTASIEERTKRRFLELKASGTETTMDEVRTNLIERDKKDSERAVAPLVQTEDAICIDNTNLDKEQTIEAILSYIKK
ncbi:Cytidylate kinase [Riemerella anatipestifer]|uniref:Cytidylate kinase n=2 Tax=Riemerella anatipestifer TaxID=34085 RepID=A0A1S7DQ72_RIEAN|nr:Cytidylate kinase [Riemerella anatipestifer]